MLCLSPGRCLDPICAPGILGMPEGGSEVRSRQERPQSLHSGAVSNREVAGPPTTPGSQLSWDLGPGSGSFMPGRALLKTAATNATGFDALQSELHPTKAYPSYRSLAARWKNSAGRLDGFEPPNRSSPWVKRDSLPSWRQLLPGVWYERAS